MELRAGIPPCPAFEYAVMRHQATAESVLHTVSVRAPQALTVSFGQTVHVSHRPFSGPVHPLAKYLPAVHVEQALHVVPPVASWYVPAPHRRHADVWALGLNVPYGQGLQTAFCVALQLSPQEKPASQVMHVLQAVPLALAWNLPLAHPSQTSILLPELKVPAWQSRHSRSAVALQACPW